MVFSTLKKYTIIDENNLASKKHKKYLKKILNHAIKYLKLSKINFNIIIVDNNYIQKLNKEYRSIDNPTDVISFALEDYQDIKNKITLLGDIYISYDKVEEQALSYGHSTYRELCFLAIHGLLHLLGYNHETKQDEQEMFTLQEKILNGKKFCQR